MTLTPMDAEMERGQYEDYLVDAAKHRSNNEKLQFYEGRKEPFYCGALDWMEKREPGLASRLRPRTCGISPAGS